MEKEVQEEVGMSKSSFYDKYWPEIKEVEGVKCVDGKYTYTKPDALAGDPACIPANN